LNKKNWAMVFQSERTTQRQWSKGGCMQRRVVPSGEEVGNKGNDIEKKDI
jgi:hypothetical protein